MKNGPSNCRLVSHQVIHFDLVYFQDWLPVLCHSQNFIFFKLYSFENQVVLEDFTR